MQSRCLPFIYCPRHHEPLAFYPPSQSPAVDAPLWSHHQSGEHSGGLPSHVDGLHELAASSGNSPTVTRRLVVSYTTFSPLPHTIANGRNRSLALRGGYFLLPSPTVTSCFYFQKWSALRCPDFPLASPFSNASGRPRKCFQPAKIHIFHKTSKRIPHFLNIEQ